MPADKEFVQLREGETAEVQVERERRTVRRLRQEKGLAQQALAGRPLPEKKKEAIDAFNQLKPLSSEVDLGNAVAMKALPI